ncbi:hypothetical protein C0991_001236 [Blastosporella zonata]|nr:hypothetical protein C0991_001236 [Blastosporella zonata]
MLLIGKPIPILGCGPTPASLSGLVISSMSEVSLCHLSTCSSTVARIPCALELKVRRAPNRESSKRVAFRMCEKENKSDGVFIRFSGVGRPPPTFIVRKGNQNKKHKYLRLISESQHHSRRTQWWPEWPED